MPKRTYTIPSDLCENLEKEAQKRLIEMNKIGRRLLGSVSRDIIILCLKQFSLGEVRQMSHDEYDEAIKKYVRGNRH